MANPSLMGSVLARETNGQNVAIIQLGSTLPSTTPPTRIAEEYAMLDCISGGRLVAGFPTGLPTDAVICNGVVPIEQRERFREALALVTQGVVGEGHVRLERQALSARHGEPLAAADPAAASADLDSRLRHLVDGRIRRRPRPLLLPPELLRRQERRARGRPLLGAGGEQGPRRQSVSLQLPAAHRRRRDRCRGRGALRAARRVFLQQAAVHAVVLSADSGLPRIPGAGAGAAEQSARRDQPARAQGQGFLRARLRDRRQPEDRARATDRGREAAAHRPPADAPAFRLDADRRCASATSTCSRARSCRISKACGTTSTRIAGGPSASAPSRAASRAMAAAE